MLSIYSVSLEVVSEMRPVLSAIRSHDAELACQLRRALTSVSLNLAEGSYSRGGNQPKHYNLAMGSAREALACLEVAQAFGYIENVDPMLNDKLQRIIATLINVLGLGRK